MYAQFLDTTFDATLLRLGLPLSPLFSFDGVWAHLVVPALFFGPLFASALSRELPLQRALAVARARCRPVLYHAGGTELRAGAAH